MVIKFRTAYTRFELIGYQFIRLLTKAKIQRESAIFIQSIKYNPQDNIPACVQYS